MVAGDEKRQRRPTAIDNKPRIAVGVTPLCRYVDPAKLQQQLSSLGLFDAARVKHTGFTTRMLYAGKSMD
jgi:hypothetical protein